MCHDALELGGAPLCSCSVVSVFHHAEHTWERGQLFRGCQSRPTFFFFCFLMILILFFFMIICIYSYRRLFAFGLGTFPCEMIVTVGDGFTEWRTKACNCRETILDETSLWNSLACIPAGHSSSGHTLHDILLLRDRLSLSLCKSSKHPCPLLCFVTGASDVTLLTFRHFVCRLIFASSSLVLASRVDLVRLTMDFDPLL